MDAEANLSTRRIDPRQLRRSLSCFPTGVAIVTTIGREDSPIGFTISSFNSVSMDPPLIVWSIALKAGSIEDFRSNSWFAINVLSADQADLPKVFSSAVEERFAGLRWQQGVGGAPVLAGCAAVFECRTHGRHEGGDHEIVVGEVLRHRNTDLVPLVFGKGQLGPLGLAANA